MDLIVIEHREKRVLTTAQIAESYGTNKDRISANFKENEKRFKEGKHFISLQGEELKEFKNEPRNSGLVGKNASNLYLWTEKGAWLHAKSLNTDEAWEAYELLVDEYYKVIEKQPQGLELALQAALHHEREIKSIKSDVAFLKDSMRIDTLQQRDIQSVAGQSVIHSLGGKESNAYQQKSIRTKVFSAFWNEFKNYFKVPRYGDLPKSKYDEALRFIKLWRPSTSLQIEIDENNAQMVWDEKYA